MSPRIDIIVALSCCCLVLSFLTIQARNLPETAVKKRDVSDWLSYLDDLIYDSDSEEDTKKILVCTNCTVQVQPAPAEGTAPGCTAATANNGTTPAVTPAATPDPPAPTASASAPSTQTPAAPGGGG